MKRITLENFQEISKNQNVLVAVKSHLNMGHILVVGNNRAVGTFVCDCDWGPVQQITSDIYTKSKAIEFEAQAHGKFNDAEDSFERCDTDGFLSQWASGLTGQLLLAQAQIAEDGGYSFFSRLWDVAEDREINAKLIEGQYGMVWIVDDEDTHQFNGRKFIPFAGYCVHCDDPDHQYKRGPKKGTCKKCKGTGRGNSRIQNSLGLIEKDVMKPAHAVITGSGRGLSGSAWVDVVEVAEVYTIYKDEEI